MSVGNRMYRKIMELKEKINILFERLLPRNKIARFLVLEVIALIISFFLFLPFEIAFFYYFLPQDELNSAIRGSISEAFTIMATFFVAVFFALICSLPHTVLIHRYLFKKFYYITRRKKFETYLRD
jgi:hypothetical protein